jgi:beta-fructofuranosidase
MSTVLMNDRRTQPQSDTGETPLQFKTPGWTRRQLLSRGAAFAVASNFSLEPTLITRAFGESVPDLAKNPRRPQFHLLPAANWMNDPNGPIYWKGKYHMFFQYNPHGAYWGDMHWAHAVSPDMVHWQHLPVALSPTPGGPDQDGCFSGSAVVINGVATFIYTGVVTVPKEEATLRDGNSNLRETQCIATCDQPLLNAWAKLPKPVIPTPPPGLEVTGFRDPCPWSLGPWRHGDWWYLNVGSGMRGKGGMILLYRSKDFHHWEYLHPLVEGTMPTSSVNANIANPVDSGEMWECPDFFALRDKHVLIYSTQGKVFWQSGKLDAASMRFEPEHTGVLDHGSYYAPKTQLDRDGNRILWGWLPELRPVQEYRAAGWAGMMSLPRVLSLNSGGMLEMRVLPGVETLRSREQILKQTGTDKGNQEQISAIRLGDCCGEILCTTLSKERFAFSLYLEDASQPSGQELVKAEWNPDTRKLFFGGTGTAIDLDEKRLELKMYVDGSVIEFFANGLYAHTTRFYYSGDRAPEICVAIGGRTEDIERLSVWQMDPISSDRLTRDNYRS